MPIGFRGGKIPVFSYDFSMDVQVVCIPEIEKVIFNGQATIIIWGDGDKTVVKCREGEVFDEHTGFAMAYLKKLWGNNFHRMFKEWCD